MKCKFCGATQDSPQWEGNHYIVLQYRRSYITARDDIIEEDAGVFCSSNHLIAYLSQVGD